MKNKIRVLFIMANIAATVISSITFAQNQSMLLPVPGGSSTSITGSKVINFVNPTNPVITSLPFYTFNYGGVQGDPHVEQQLQSVASLMNEKYLGQHPMFAQQVVHDKDGNLLFFIVDNNIYNRKGKGFIKLDDPDGIRDPAYYSYLHDGEVFFIDNHYPTSDLAANVYGGFDFFYCFISFY